MRRTQMLPSVAESYWDLHAWSVENYPEFWERVWHFMQIQHSQTYSQVPWVVQVSWRCKNPQAARQNAICCCYVVWFEQNATRSFDGVTKALFSCDPLGKRVCARSLVLH